MVVVVVLFEMCAKYSCLPLRDSEVVRQAYWVAAARRLGRALRGPAAIPISLVNGCHGRMGGALRGSSADRIAGAD